MKLRGNFVGMLLALGVVGAIGGCGQQAGENKAEEFASLAALVDEPLPPVPTGVPAAPPAGAAYVESFPSTDNAREANDTPLPDMDMDMSGDMDMDMDMSGDMDMDMSGDMMAAPEPVAPKPPAVRKTSVEFCVETNYPFNYNIAIAYYDLSKQAWRSRGWYDIRERECKTLITGPIGDTLYLRGSYNLYAQPSGDDVEDFVKVMVMLGSSGTIEGNTRFCTTQKAFDIVGHMRCASRGYGMADFLGITINGNANTVVELYGDGQLRSGTVP